MTLRALALLSSLLLALGGQDAVAAILETAATSNETQTTFEMVSSGPYQFKRVYIDTDENSSSGFKQNGVGAEFLIENRSLYRYTGNGTTWSWALAKVVNFINSGNRAQWVVNRADLSWTGSPKGARIIFQQETATQPIETSAPARLLSHAADNTTIIPNPERGFYSFSLGDCNSNYFQAQKLRTLKNEGIRLIYCPIKLNTFISSDVSAAFLSKLAANLGVVRQAGMKVIIRAEYANAATVAVDRRNARLSIILRHIQQLRPILTTNADVIAAMHAGFIGVWGEWWLTTAEFGTNGTVSAAQWANRKAVVNALLAALPTNRTVSVRTPRYKQAMYGAALLTSSEAFSGSARARVGFHNDCFLADATDRGTFLTAAERTYAAAEARYVPMGGETCAVSRYSGWPTASMNMRQFRFSYLNKSYNRAVLLSWGRNIHEADRRLGYRLLTTHSYVPTRAAQNSKFRLNVGLENLGYAAPINPRVVEVVLRHRATKVMTRKTLRGEMRTWWPGQLIRLDQAVSLSGLPAGAYDVGLAFPDPAFSLRQRPDYAIRLANPTGWDATLGVNFLGHVLEVQ